MRLVFLSDIHLDGTEFSRQGFQKCLNAIASLEPKPDFLINGGDVIQDGLKLDKHTCIEQWEIFKEMMDELPYPIFHTIGNHDLSAWEPNVLARSLSLKYFEQNNNYFHFNQGGWTFIILDSTREKLDGTWYEAGLDPEQFQWLKNTLAMIKKPVCIISHIPILSAAAFLDGDNVVKGEWQVPGGWMHLDSKELVNLFAEHPQVKLCLSGHLHLHDKVVYNNVSYMCCGAVSGNWWKGNYQQTPPGYGVVDINPDGTFDARFTPY